MVPLLFCFASRRQEVSSACGFIGEADKRSRNRRALIAENDGDKGVCWKSCMRESFSRRIKHTGCYRGFSMLLYLISRARDGGLLFQPQLVAFARPFQ